MVSTQRHGESRPALWWRLAWNGWNVARGFFAGLRATREFELRREPLGGFGQVAGWSNERGQFLWADQLRATEIAFAHFERIFVWWQSIWRRPIRFRGEFWARWEFVGPQLGTIVIL